MDRNISIVYITQTDNAMHFSGQTVVMRLADGGDSATLLPPALKSITP